MTKSQANARKEINRIFIEQLVPLFAMSNSPVIMAGVPLKKHPKYKIPCHVELTLSFATETVQRSI